MAVAAAAVLPSPGWQELVMHAWVGTVSVNPTSLRKDHQRVGGLAEEPPSCGVSGHALCQL